MSAMEWVRWSTVEYLPLESVLAHNLSEDGYMLQAAYEV
jgi:hypothetical protein